MADPVDKANDTVEVCQAEAEARASSAYEAEMKQLGKEHQAAMQTIADWDVKKVQWETARSLLSMLKAQIGN